MVHEGGREEHTKLERRNGSAMEGTPPMPRHQPNVLRALDAARTQWYHFIAVVIAGMGFFTDAYDFFSISLVSTLLGRIYYKESGGILPIGVVAAIKGIALCGALVGQLVFGWLGDKMGRKRTYGVTLKLMVVCSIASGLSFRITPKSVITMLCFCRFWLGFGIGGDYPLCATIVAENSNKRTRGAFIAAVFAMQGLGNLCAGIVAVIVSYAFKTSPAYQRDKLGQADYVWRIILMFGALPALLTYYWRMTMPETARYTALIANNACQAASDMISVLQVEIAPDENEVEELVRRDRFGLFSVEFLHSYGKYLLGTTVCWFMLDVVFYSLNLFMSDIFITVGWLKEKRESPLQETYEYALIQTLVALCGLLPGYWFTVAFIEIIGRIKIQILGFTMMTAFMLGLAIPYEFWTHTGNRIGFPMMYALVFLFANFGPNTTTFVVPAEIFPARLRSTCHGISGAAGKAGAIISTFGFLFASRRIGVRNSLFILTASNIFGLVFTLLLPESKGKSLEELTGEMEEAELPEAATSFAMTEFVHNVPL